MDAWGNVTTPLGTYASLRYYTVKHTTDSLWVQAFGTWTFAQETIDSAKDYSWWANGIGFSLVDMHVDQITGAVKTIDWLKAMPTAGINEYTASTSVNVYPNPAQNEIHFAMDASKAAFIEVYDITGRSVTTIAVTSDNSGINTSSFANGQYSYSVLGKDRSILNRGKFTVIR